MNIYECDTTTSSPTLINSVTTANVVFQGDNISFLAPLSDKNHLILFLSRDTTYREIHIDRRTGVTYERESITSTPSCT